MAALFWTRASTTDRTASRGGSRGADRAAARYPPGRVANPASIIGTGDISSMPSDALSIAYILPVIVPLWKLTAGLRPAFSSSAGFLSVSYSARLFFLRLVRRAPRAHESAGRPPIATFAILSFALAALFPGINTSAACVAHAAGFRLGRAKFRSAATYIGELAKAQGTRPFSCPDLRTGIFRAAFWLRSLLGLWMGAGAWAGNSPCSFVGAIFHPCWCCSSQRLLPESPRWLAGTGPLT